MPIYRVDDAQVRNAVTGELDTGLVGQQVQIVVRDTTTAYPIQDAAGDPIPSSLVTVTPVFTTPRFYIDVDDPTDLYLDWYDVGGGARGPVNFEAVLRQLASGSVKSVNGEPPDEDGDVTVNASGVDDAGLAGLVETPTSATALALTSLYGPGVLFLDLDDPVPPGTPDGTLIYRTAGGGTPPPVPVVYATDDFERIVAAGSLGTPSGGGTYNIGIASDWSVGDGAGRWIAPAAGARDGFVQLASYSQANVEMVGAVSQQTGAVGNRYFTLSPRWVTGQAGQYGANIVLRGPTATRPLQVDFGLQKGTSNGDLQAIVAGVLTTGALGDVVRFRVRVTQVDASTTRVQARIWLDGGAEPTTWTMDATDATETALQGAGSLQISVRQNTPETIGSEARIHEYTVQSVV